MSVPSMQHYREILLHLSMQCLIAATHLEKSKESQRPVPLNRDEQMRKIEDMLTGLQSSNLIAAYMCKVSNMRGNKVRYSRPKDITYTEDILTWTGLGPKMYELGKNNASR